MWVDWGLKDWCRLGAWMIFYGAGWKMWMGYNRSRWIVGRDWRWLGHKVAALWVKAKAKAIFR